MSSDARADGHPNATVEHPLRDRLEAMARELADADPLYHPTRFWDTLNERNTDQLGRLGLERFKRCVNQNYYNWLEAPFRGTQYRSAEAFWQRLPSTTPLACRMGPVDTFECLGLTNPFADPDMAEFYPFFVGLLWHHAIAHDPERVSETLEEPALGDPLPVTFRGKRVSQDLANALRERYTLMEVMGPYRPAPPEPITVIELGAGYGRLADVLLKTAAARVWITDIPPALALSEWYLSELHADKRVFRFRPFSSFADVERELLQADIAFLTPNQLAMLPDRAADAFVSVSTLAEMRTEQADHFLGEGARLADAVFLKQWARWTNEQDGVEHDIASYATPPGFDRVVDRPDAIHPEFTELGFRRRDTPGGAA